MALVTGNQLRAARALGGVDQHAVADMSGVNVNTVRNMESSAGEPIEAGVGTLRKVQQAMELFGVEFTNGGSPGVRIRFVQARPQQRDSGEWGVLVRWRDGDAVYWMPNDEALRKADHAERRGDTRLPAALRKAAWANPKNARTHSKKQIRQIAASLRKFGFLNPIIADDNDMVLAGHGRLEAARLEGLAQVPVLRFSHLSEAQKRAYVIADNRIADRRPGTYGDAERGRATRSNQGGGGSATEDLWQEHDSRRRCPSAAAGAGQVLVAVRWMLEGVAVLEFALGKG
jgi:transcriptional regulator with XRE-family HTH domain